MKEGDTMERVAGERVRRVAGVVDARAPTQNALIRPSRPLAGALLEALHSGAPLSRRALEEEPEKTIRNAPGTPPAEVE